MDITALTLEIINELMFFRSCSPTTRFRRKLNSALNNGVSTCSLRELLCFMHMVASSIHLNCFCSLLQKADRIHTLLLRAT